MGAFGDAIAVISPAAITADVIDLSGAIYVEIAFVITAFRRNPGIEAHGAILGNVQGDLDITKEDDPYFKGKSAATLWFLLKEGTVSKIEGLDECKKDSRIIANVQRLYEGDTVPAEWVGTERQVLTRLYIVCESKQSLADTIEEYRNKVKVFDKDGNDMLLHGFSIDKMME